MCHHKVITHSLTEGVCAKVDIQANGGGVSFEVSNGTLASNRLIILGFFIALVSEEVVAKLDIRYVVEVYADGRLNSVVDGNVPVDALLLGVLSLLLFDDQFLVERIRRADFVWVDEVDEF